MTVLVSHVVIHLVKMTFTHLGEVYPIVIDPTIKNEAAKLLASDGAPGDSFSHSVSISGDTIVASAFVDNDNGIQSGSAYVFERNQGGLNNWGEVTKLLASDGAPGDRFGESVSISGDTIVVGAWLNDDNGSDSGSAYVFERNQGGSNNWGEVTKLLASDGAMFDGFGKSVSISGDTIVVGAISDGDKGFRSGSAYVFERNQGGSNNWGEVTKLLASDGAAQDQFGDPVSILGDTIVVGVWLNDDNGSNSGSAYVFERNQGGPDNWGEVTKLLASDAAPGDIFGGSVSILGDTIVAGALSNDDNGFSSGSAYVFERNQGGPDNWGEVTKLLASDAAVSDQFGRSVSISGDIIVVGVDRDDDNGSDSGSAYVFERDQGGANNWGEVTKLLASDGAMSDQFGTAVAISGGIIVASSVGDDDNGSFSGSAYIFNLFNSPPTVTADDATVEVDEGQTAINTGTVSDSDNDIVILSASEGTVLNNNDGTWDWEFATSDGPAETQMVDIDADDNNGGTAMTSFDLTVNNVDPTVDSITVPLDPVAINAPPVSASATFSDPAGMDDEPYTCTVNYGDGTGDLAGGIAGTTCTGSDHTYAAPGVYTVTVMVTDKDGGWGSAEATDFIVIYDPSAGFVTGGGWINSLAGACPVFCNDATGKANFGFVSKYKKGAQTPTGETEFQFKAGDLNFHSASYEWLVIAGAKAMYKGVGTINGTGNYGFMLSVIDEKLTPSADEDLFRIKIWDKDNGDAVVYDNQMGDAEDADPTTGIGGGSIVIHKK